MEDDRSALLTEDLGGVQGTQDDAGDDVAGAAAPDISGQPPEQPAPDEIEWAGTVLKRPPAPKN